VSLQRLLRATTPASPPHPDAAQDTIVAHDVLKIEARSLRGKLAERSSDAEALEAACVAAAVDVEAQRAAASEEARLQRAVRSWGELLGGGLSVFARGSGALWL